MNKRLIFRLEKAAHKLHYKTNFQGLPISIENQKGSYRHWYDPMENKKGKTKFKYPYGYIRLTEGEDGDHVDVFIGDNKNSPHVFIMRQQDPNTGMYDEDKCMLGFNTMKEAADAYLGHYDKKDFLGDVDYLPIGTFKEKIKEKSGRIGKSMKMIISLSKSAGYFPVPATRKGAKTKQIEYCGHLDILDGGKADMETPQSIADKHGVSVGDIEKQLKMGIKVEYEHTDDYRLAREIALDHLFELPDYYDRLDEMEEAGKAEISKSIALRKAEKSGFIKKPIIIKSQGKVKKVTVWERGSFKYNKSTILKSKKKKTEEEKKFEKVMREFKNGTLTSNGKVVTDREQALAIAFSVSGMSKSLKIGIKKNGVYQ